MCHPVNFAIPGAALVVVGAVLGELWGAVLFSISAQDKLERL